jgi:hypothetical protein
MRLRIDTEGVQFFCTKAPEQRTAHDTGAPRMDRETGLPLWQVQVMALDASGGEVMAITVAGQPNVSVGSLAKVTGLTALPWSQEGRSGVAFRAEAIASIGAPVAGVIAPNRPANSGGGSAGPERPAA